MAGTVEIPGTGKRVPKWAVFAGLGVVGVLIIVYYRNKSSAAAAPPAAAAGTTAAGLATPAAGGSDPYPWDGTYNNPSDPYSMDTSTGITYGDEAAGIGGSGYPFGSGGGGYGYGGQGSPGSGGVGGPPFSTNAQWADYVIAQLEANDPNLSPTDVQTAIGEYLNGQPVPTNLKNIVFDAIAIGQDPPQAGPNGYPPAIQTSGQPGTTQVKVPDIVGNNVDTARSAISTAGLVLQTQPNITTRGTEYQVTSESPAAGTTVDKGSTVTASVKNTVAAGGGGAGQVTVPNVVGQTVAAAGNTLRGAGLVLSTEPNITTKASQYQITGQTPRAGSKANRGSSVRCTVKDLQPARR